MSPTSATQLCILSVLRITKPTPPLVGITFKGPLTRLPQLPHSSATLTHFWIDPRSIAPQFRLQKKKPAALTPLGLQVELETLRGITPCFLITRRRASTGTVYAELRLMDCLHDSPYLPWTSLYRVIGWDPLILTRNITFRQSVEPDSRSVELKLFKMTAAGSTVIADETAQVLHMKVRGSPLLRGLRSPPSAKVRNAPWLWITNDTYQEPGHQREAAHCQLRRSLQLPWHCQQRISGWRVWRRERGSAEINQQRRSGDTKCSLKKSTLGWRF